MFDIGFWELLVIAVVLLLVMGPERLPEVAKQAAFLIRKARQGMYRLRSEMRSEIDATPFADLQKARQEMTDFKNDIRQFGRELADSAEEEINMEGGANQSATSNPAEASEHSNTVATADYDDNSVPTDTSKENKKVAKKASKKVARKSAKKVTRKVVKKTAKKATNKTAKKKVAKKKTSRSKAS